MMSGRSRALPRAQTFFERQTAAFEEAPDGAHTRDGGFKDRDLYVLCANASDGIITAHPTRKGGQLKGEPHYCSTNADCTGGAGCKVCWAGLCGR